MTNHHRIRRAVLAAPLAAWLLVPAAATQAAPEANPPAPSAQKSDPAAELRRQEIELRNAVRANHSDPAAHIKLAQTYIKLGNFTAAEAETREARRTGGDEDETHHNGHGPNPAPQFRKIVNKNECARRCESDHREERQEI